MSKGWWRASGQAAKDDHVPIVGQHGHASRNLVVGCYVGGLCAVLQVKQHQHSLPPQQAGLHLGQVPGKVSPGLGCDRIHGSRQNISCPAR